MCSLPQLGPAGCRLINFPRITNSRIGTVTPDANGSAVTDQALSEFSHSGALIRPEDAGLQIRTIFFEVVGACISVATTVVAVLALRQMPKQK
jgi:hypothetical protein